MSFITAALIVGGIGAAGAIGSSLIQSGAQNKAANTQEGMFNTITGQEQPFLQGGYGAETGLNQLLGTAPGSFNGTPNGYLTQQFSPKDLQNYPGYQFQLQQGDQAIQNSAAASTGAVSGPALKSLVNYNQGLAGTTYNNAFNQFQTQQTNIFNRLNSIAGLGQNAAGNLGNAGTSLGTGIAQAQAAAGGSLAGGVVGATNSIGNGVLLNGLMNGGATGGINDPTSGAFSAGTGTTSGTAYNLLYGGD